jgi:hypothetical protein
VGGLSRAASIRAASIRAASIRAASIRADIEVCAGIGVASVPCAGL